MRNRRAEFFAILGVVGLAAAWLLRSTDSVDSNERSNGAAKVDVAGSTVPAVLPAVAGERAAVIPSAESESLDSALAVVIRDDAATPVSGLRVEVKLRREFDDAVTPPCDWSPLERSAYLRLELAREGRDVLSSAAREIVDRAASNTALSIAEFDRAATLLDPEPQFRQFRHRAFRSTEVVLGSAATDRDGAASFDLPRGRYLVGVVTNRHVTFHADDSRPAGARPIERNACVVELGERAVAIDGVVGSACVNGVLVADGLEGTTTIKLLRVSGAHAEQNIDWSVDECARCDSRDGSFRFEGLRAGRYSIHAVGALRNHAFTIFERPFEISSDEIKDLGAVTPPGNAAIGARIVLRRDGAEARLSEIMRATAPPPTERPKEPSVVLRLELPVPREPQAFQYFFTVPTAQSFRLTGLPTATVQLGVLASPGPLSRASLDPNFALRWPERRDVVTGTDGVEFVIEALSTVDAKFRVAVDTIGRAAKVRVVLRAQGDDYVFGVGGTARPGDPFEAALRLARGVYEYIAFEAGPDVDRDHTGFVAHGICEVTGRDCVREFPLAAAAAVEWVLRDPSGAPYRRAVSVAPEGWRDSRGESIYHAQPDALGVVRLRGLPPATRMVDASGRGIPAFVTPKAGERTRIEATSAR